MPKKKTKRAMPAGEPPVTLDPEPEPRPPEPAPRPEPPCIATARAEVEAAEALIAVLEDKLKAAKAGLKSARRALCDAHWTDEAAAWRAERRIWLTGEGQEVFYRDMSESHLDNAIGLMSLRLGPGSSHPGLKGLMDERSRRRSLEERSGGQMAAEA